MEAGAKMLKADAMLRTLHEDGYIVYEPRIPGPFELVLLDDETGALKGMSFNDESWEAVKGNTVLRQPMNPSEYWGERLLESFRIPAYRDSIGQGPFEYVIAGWQNTLLSLKILEKLAPTKPIYLPVDIILVVKNMNKRVWVPRTDAGEMFCNNLVREFGIEFTGKIWKDYIDARGFHRLRVYNPEWWMRFALDRRPRRFEAPNPDGQSNVYLKGVDLKTPRAGEASELMH